MFQFAASPFCTLWIYVQIPKVFSGRFPHSDISGSLAMCASPKLFAAYHVLHRLPVPRHSPCALSCLTLKCSSVTTFLIEVFKNFFFLDFWLFFLVFSFQGANRLIVCPWRLRDSNSRPPACKAGALPTELNPHLLLFIFTWKNGLKWTRTTDLALIRRAL